MSSPTVFGVYGESDAGKTTLIVRIVAQLTNEGYRVATVKQTKKAISMDAEGKDTWRHHEAGADLVVFSSRCETDFLLSKAMRAPEIVQMITAFGWYDFILVEGADDPAIPKIQVGKGKKRKNTVALYSDNVREIVTMIKRQRKTQPSSRRLLVQVNGKDVPLAPFPEQIISNALVGMLGSLKGVQDIHEISIQLKRYSK